MNETDPQKLKEALELAEKCYFTGYCFHDRNYDLNQNSMVYGQHGREQLCPEDREWLKGKINAGYSDFSFRIRRVPTGRVTGHGEPRSTGYYYALSLAPGMPINTDIRLTPEDTLMFKGFDYKDTRIVAKNFKEKALPEYHGPNGGCGDSRKNVMSKFREILTMNNEQVMEFFQIDRTIFPPETMQQLLENDKQRALAQAQESLQTGIDLDDQLGKDVVDKELI